MPMRPVRVCACASLRPPASPACTENRAIELCDCSFSEPIPAIASTPQNCVYKKPDMVCQESNLPVKEDDPVKEGDSTYDSTSIRDLTRTSTTSKGACMAACATVWPCCQRARSERYVYGYSNWGYARYATRTVYDKKCDSKCGEDIANDNIALPFSKWRENLDLRCVFAIGSQRLWCRGSQPKHPGAFGAGGPNHNTSRVQLRYKEVQIPCRLY